MSRTPKLILTSVLFAGVALSNIHSAQAKPDHSKPKNQLDGGTPLSAEDKKHLLEDNFVLVRTVAAIPLAVQKKMLGSEIRGGMADPNQPYQDTDVLESKPLPFRRLIYAGTSEGCCFVYNEYGGFAPGQEVYLYRLLPGKASLVWQAHLQSSKKYLSLSELRSVVGKGMFYSDRLPKQS